MPWSKKQLKKMLHNIHLAAASLSDEQALETPELFPNWEPDTDYSVGDRDRDDGQLYKCVQAHRSQEDWRPSLTPNLWTPVAEPGEIPVWKQPTGVQDAYMMGDKVHYPDKTDPVYVSNVDNNVWAPDVYGWSPAE